MFLLRIPQKYRKILTDSQIKHIPGLILMMVIAGIMEMASVSLILPFMNIVTEPQVTMDKWYIKFFYDQFRISSFESLLIIISVLLALLYIVKNIYILWEIRILQKYTYTAMIELQSRLMERVIFRPYEYFMSLNSERVLTILYNSVSNSFSLLNGFLSMCSELITSGLLIITIFVINPQISLLIGIVLFILLLIVAKIIKPALRRASAEVQEGSQGMFRWILQSIQGIKEIKITETEDFFLNEYKKSGSMYANATWKNAVLNNTPKSLIEAVSMAAFFISIAVYISVNGNIGNIFPVIAAIAMAAIRLLPASNRISVTIAQIAFVEPYLDNLIDFMEEDINNIKTPDLFLEHSDRSDNEKNGMSEINEICMENITYSYPGTETAILNNVSLMIRRGESVGIVGTSGAGKTTTIDIMLGLLKPQSGKVTIDKTDINENIQYWLSQVGYIPQSIFMMDDTIRANVAFGIPADDVEENLVWQALDDAALGDYVRELPNKLDTTIGERGIRLSGGQRQRIGIARALYRKPQVLFLDEATSALDNDTENAIMESVKVLKGKITLIIIAHRLTTIESCDHIYRVDNGKILIER